MNPAEVVATLRQFNEWLRGDRYDIAAPTTCEMGEAIDAAVEMIERVAALPTRITPEQAPGYVRAYSHEAAEGYADGWNDCIKAMEKKTK